MTDKPDNVVALKKTPKRDDNSAAADVSFLSDADELKRTLPLDWAGLVKRKTAMIEGVERLLASLTVTDPATGKPDIRLRDEVMAQRVTEFLAQLGGCQREIEKKRKKVKKPYTDAEKALDKWFNDHWDAVDTALAKVKAIYDPYLTGRAEAARDAMLAEAAAKRAEADTLATSGKQADIDRALELEQEAQDCEAKADNHTSVAGRVTGEWGSTGYLKTGLVVEITNIEAVPVEFQMDERVQAAITAATKAALIAVIRECIESGAAKDMFGDETKIPGCRVSRTHASVVRKAR